ncbi:phosphotransferase [Catellatospora sp. KI3]|uniref:phosphotransferase enzyme family protein n=1 Tax=Catellatospora sp. KI3 TaxID=3041620 RepID=UPI002482E7FA|nr:phosphotransferase [Catellatospora sp. KI3]MDI1466347.1 phosphotransferase [Catellatospora sp. KI3]
MLADDTFRATLRTAWHVQPDGFTPLSGGMTSTTVSVTACGATYVAKAVRPGQKAQFEAGLAAAEHLSRRGVDSGAPLRTADGALTVPVGDHVVALLRHVSGRELDAADPLDQQWWGDRLGAVHLALRDFRHPGLPAWHWVRPDAPHLGVEDWIRPAVTAAVNALTKLQVTDRLTYGALHGDPYHGAFLLDPATGRIGVIDWGSAVAGPLMYDVASAVMYAGGPDRAGELLAGYAATGVVPRAEIEASLDVLLRFRWAVQADYFAARLTTGDLTGIAGQDDNRKGLHDARTALLG